ncbi:ElyC/SanA/YdcF family protein [Bifidobacterium sp. ESL0745]|uniref:YdcF family protein n=1 Tax=Bifidobacterium sp. ESL0745 TaxID=2983226 RepID=UPI0023F8B8FF|nr:ElyC/SanA/YdcF family protein [Bifidobacterium sp. ESL0745]MDF7664996.1 ElyC/SanA/YdcF family protein [Bifidobacterium sp. ESL0745]
MTDWWQVVLLYGPAVLFGLLLVFSVVQEPRRFRNAIWLALFVLSLSSALMLDFWWDWAFIPIVLVAVFTPVIVVGFLVINTFIVVRHEGFSLSTILPALFALVMMACILIYPLTFYFNASQWGKSIGLLIALEGLWFFFTFAALLLYSTIYRILPRRRQYDYIIILGAGLRGTKPTPLLRGRIDKAVDLWLRQERKGLFVVSGGQGADEEISEAEAMKRYLVEERGVPAEKIIKEDQSTTTFENLRNSKVIMDSRSGIGPSSDYQSLSANTRRISRLDIGNDVSDIGDSAQSSSVSAIPGFQPGRVAIQSSTSLPPTEHKPGRVKRMKNRMSCPYRVAVVTSDYHVFRASEYARDLGLKSDGVGSHTKGYYWPTAFIREFIAISKAHFWPYVAIFALWVIGMAVISFGR